MGLACFNYKTLNCQDCPWVWRNQTMAYWCLGLDARLMMTDKVKDRFDSCADFDVEWWACCALSSQRWILWKDISLQATHISFLTDQPWSYQKPSLCSFSQRLIFCGGIDCDYYANCRHYPNQNQLGCMGSATLLSPECQDHRANIKLARWYQQKLQVFINSGGKITRHQVISDSR